MISWALALSLIFIQNLSLLMIKDMSLLKLSLVHVVTAGWVAFSFWQAERARPMGKMGSGSVFFFFKTFAPSPFCVLRSPGFFRERNL